MTQSVKITPEIEDELYRLISAGNYPAIACQAVGIPPSLYTNWIKRGEYRDRRGDPTPDQVRFAQRMREAEALAETKVVQAITDPKTLEKYPELGLKFLSRRYKDRWGDTQEININWTLQAVQYIKDGEMTLKDLADEISPARLAEIKALLPPEIIENEVASEMAKQEQDSE